MNRSKIYRLRVLVLLAAMMPVLASLADDAYIVVDKPSMYMYVVEDSDTVFCARVCLDRNIGNKSRRGDMKTPEGIFTINSIERSGDWTHDFKDGKGEVRGAYGPWFFRLAVPDFVSIGIHGTCHPESIGKRESNGCIRLRNEELEILRDIVRLGMRVVITPDNVASEN